ncbi:MAG: hypothetical protein QOD00_36, partial [Blastocatellia bacterium]|nr:hypothetical protein [Blastocatellia bacterium]
MLRRCIFAVTLAGCILLILAGGFALPAARAQTRGWLWQNPLPQGNAISAIRFASDKMHGWAVGSDGAILRTNDGGFEWETQNSPVSSTLYGLYVKDEKRALAVGARGIVLTTTNGGEKWTIRLTGSREHLYSVAFAPDDKSCGWAVGTHGVILKTKDGGNNWSPLASNTKAHLFSVSFADKHTGAAVGERGALLLTTDG